MLPIISIALRRGTISRIRNRGISTISPAAQSTTIRNYIPTLKVHTRETTQLTNHVAQVAQHLEINGALSIRLSFDDDSSQYLKQLLTALHNRHYHQLPIAHSASQGWFWDIRPRTTGFQTQNHQARSETMANFPWHTDCSYEVQPPRYFALQVLQPDRYGGGNLSLLHIGRWIMEHLSRETIQALTRPEFRFRIPSEFIKDPTVEFISSSVLEIDNHSMGMRFRDDITQPLTPRAAVALDQLRQALGKVDVATTPQLMRLTAHDLPRGSIVLINNRRWLHARDFVRDQDRHLRRVRWDAVPFGGQNTVDGYTTLDNITEKLPLNKS